MYNSFSIENTIQRMATAHVDAMKISTLNFYIVAKKSLSQRIERFYALLIILSRVFV
jgi:hypothetical protein